MIKLSNVSAGYSKKEILHDISAHFVEGKITVILGPNGSGKSTLLKALTGLSSVTGGEIFLKDKPLSSHTSIERARIMSYLPQQRPLPAISVERMVLHGRFPYLDYPRRYKKSDHEICRAAMEQAGVLHLKSRKLEELSGGERQKVYLAMAYAGNSEVLLLDEPMTFLDIRYQLELLDMLLKLKSEGKTVVAILHDLNAAMQTADHIIVMNSGKIAASGTPEEIYKSGILEDVFKVKQNLLYDECGKKHYFFSAREA